MCYAVSYSTNKIPRQSSTDIALPMIIDDNIEYYVKHTINDHFILSRPKRHSAIRRHRADATQMRKCSKCDHAAVCDHKRA
jgi:hypothetical protein